VLVWPPATKCLTAEVKGASAEVAVSFRPKAQLSTLRKARASAGSAAGDGLETAHHGPDAGTPGKGDGCYAVEDDAPPPRDTNPAID
jgi:hypothetical protein